MLWCDSVAPLGKPVVPEVYWMLIGSSKASVAARSRSAAGSPSGRRQRRPSRRRRGRSTSARARSRLDHRPVVAGLVARPRRPAGDMPDCLQHVRQLVGAVGRVDVDQDRADLRRGVLDEHPLGAVRRPDADPVALGDRRRASRPERHLVDLGVELGVGPAAAGGHVDQRLTVAEPGRRCGRGSRRWSRRAAARRRCRRRRTTFPQHGPPGQIRTTPVQGRRLAALVTRADAGGRSAVRPGCGHLPGSATRPVPVDARRPLG